MQESDLIQGLHRYIADDGLLKTTLHSQAMEASKHTMRPKHGYNDVSRYTWSSVQPASSDLPAKVELQAQDVRGQSIKGKEDARMW